MVHHQLLLVVMEQSMCLCNVQGPDPTATTDDSCALGSPANDQLAVGSGTNVVVEPGIASDRKPRRVGKRAQRFRRLLHGDAVDENGGHARSLQFSNRGA